MSLKKSLLIGAWLGPLVPVMAWNLGFISNTAVLVWLLFQIASSVGALPVALSDIEAERRKEDERLKQLADLYRTC
jgi:hypothetical protein